MPREIVTNTTINCTDCGDTFTGVISFTKNEGTSPGADATAIGSIIAEAAEHHRLSADPDAMWTGDSKHHRVFELCEPNSTEIAGHLIVSAGFENRQDYINGSGQLSGVIRSIL